MAYPTPSTQSPSTQGFQHGSVSRCPQASGISAPSGLHAGFPPASGEGDHQLEKLEFALAVALTRGDLQRSQTLREQIAALGGNQEEPGT